MFRRFSDSLLEGVKHIDALCKLSHIKDSIFESSMDTDFPDTRSHGRHRLPVVRFKSLLDAPELEARDAACIWRNAWRSLREEPSQNRGLSGTVQYASISISCQVRENPVIDAVA
jgi:hypothetical protein